MPLPYRCSFFPHQIDNISDEAKTSPELLTTAPHNTPIRRTDDALAVKRAILTYDDELKLKDELNYQEKDINF